MTATRDEDTDPRSVVTTSEAGPATPLTQTDPGVGGHTPTDPGGVDGVVWSQEVDTEPDQEAEMRSLLAGLMPRDGRYPPPHGPKKTGAKSDGRDFVAYAGEAPLPVGNATADPLPAVLLAAVPPKNNLRELALAALSEDEAVAQANERDRQVVETTHVLPGRRSWGPWFAACGVGTGLIVAIMLIFRGTSPPVVTAPVSAPPTPNVQRPLPSAPTVDVGSRGVATQTPAPSAPTSAPTAPRPTPAPTAALASDPTPVRSPSATGSSSAKESPDPTKRPPIDRGVNPF